MGHIKKIDLDINQYKDRLHVIFSGQTEIVISLMIRDDTPKPHMLLNKAVARERDFSTLSLRDFGSAF